METIIRDIPRPQENSSHPVTGSSAEDKVVSVIRIKTVMFFTKSKYAYHFGISDKRFLIPVTISTYASSRFLYELTGFPLFGRPCN